MFDDKDGTAIKEDDDDDLSDSEESVYSGLEDSGSDSDDEDDDDDDEDDLEDENDEDSPNEGLDLDADDIISDAEADVNHSEVFCTSAILVVDSLYISAICCFSRMPNQMIFDSCNAPCLIAPWKGFFRHCVDFFVV